MQTKKVFFLNKEKEKLAGVLHLPDKKTDKAIIVCHGFGSGKDELWMPKLCNALALENYAALRFDFSGNGKSEGKFEDSDCEKEKQDLKSAIKFLKEQKYTSITTIGHSVGGTVVLMSATENKNVRAVISIAAAIHTKKVENRLLTTKEKKELRDKGKVIINLGNKYHTLTKKFFDAFEKQKVLKNAGKIKASILLIHGSDDHTIPLKESESVKKKVPTLKLTVIEGGTHTLMKGKSTEILISTIIQWLKLNF